MVYLNVFGDKQWVQDSSTTVVCIFHLAVMKWKFKMKFTQHWVFLCYPVSSIDKTNPLFLWLRIYRKMKFCNLFLFITGITKSTLWSCTVINYSLKPKVLFFAEFFKHIRERVNFSQVRGLKPATLVTINTFTGIFQGSCLIWTKNYLTNIPQLLFLTKRKSRRDYKE